MKVAAAAPRVPGDQHDERVRRAEHDLAEREQPRPALRRRRGLRLLEEAAGEPADQQQRAADESDPGEQARKRCPVQHDEGERDRQQGEPRQRRAAPLGIEPQQLEIEGAIAGAGRGQLLARLAHMQRHAPPLRHDPRVRAATRSIISAVTSDMRTELETNTRDDGAETLTGG